MHKPRKIDKPLILVVSAGRTGTKFFGQYMQYAIPGSISYHEPDLISLWDPSTWKRVMEFGVQQTITGRIQDKKGIRALAGRYINGTLTDTQVADEIYEHRSDFYGKHFQEPIIESYYAWFGLLPVLPYAFEKYNVIAIIRDPRSWVASTLSKKVFWAAKDIISFLGLSRLSPDMVGDEQYSQSWKHMGEFERLCWTWSTVTNYIVGASRSDRHVKIYRFEDLFQSPDSITYMNDLLKFAVGFDDMTYDYNVDSLPLDTRINSSSSSDTGDSWRLWPREKCVFMDKICGELMRQFNYGTETDWLEMLDTKYTT